MKTAVRGALLSFSADPLREEADSCMQYEPDGIVLMEAGRIVDLGPASRILPLLGPDTELVHYPHKLILPGFIDSHVHYPQTEMIAAPGGQLLEWLERYTFVVEQRFAEQAHADRVAAFFVSELLRNGTTCAATFCTVHPQSVDALFGAAARYDMRLLAGKVCMDIHAPAALLDTPQRAWDESGELIARWHGKGRAEYVITPRFAGSSTREQLEMLGALAARHPDMAIQSHVAENRAEVHWMRRRFPECEHYTGIYHRYGLLRPRAVYGHGIYLAESERHLLAETGAAIAHCPTSNFFLGSGAFNVHQARQAALPVKVGLATDIGAGTSFSMLATMGAAYKAAQLNGNALSARQAFYLATRGGAEALGIADKVGSLAVGLEADLCVLDLHSTPLIDFRMQQADSLDDVLFVQMMLADDRAVAATWVAGRCVYSAAAA